MKPKKYTSLYLSESLFPIFFCVAVIFLEFMFYFRLLGGATIDPSEATKPGVTNVVSSSILDLLPVPFFIAGIVFIIIYMLLRFVTFDDNGITYKDRKNSHFISWQDVQYIKITFNANKVIGRGSYIVLSTTPYALQESDFRASREGFIVLRYRHSAIKLIQQHTDVEIIKSSVK